MSLTRQLINETTTDVVPTLVLNPKIQRRKRAWWQRDSIDDDDDDEVKESSSLVELLIEDEEIHTSHSLIPNDAKTKVSGQQDRYQDTKPHEASEPSIPDFAPISPASILIAPDCTPGANRPIDPKYLPSGDQSKSETDRDRVMSLMLGRRDPNKGPTKPISQAQFPQAEAPQDESQKSQVDARVKMFEAMGYAAKKEENALEIPAVQPTLSETVAASTEAGVGTGMPSPVSKSTVAASVNRFRSFTG